MEIDSVTFAPASLEAQAAWARRISAKLNGRSLARSLVIYPPAPFRRTRQILQRFLGCGPVLFIQRQHPRKQPCGPRGPSAIRAPFSDWNQPCQSNVIGVVMGHDDPAHRLAATAARPSNSLSHIARVRFDENPVSTMRPALAVIQRIDIHMVQLHRQRQPASRECPAPLRVAMPSSGGVSHGYRMPAATAVHHAAARSSGLSAIKRLGTGALTAPKDCACSGKSRSM